MLRDVAVGRWSLKAYRGIVPEPILEELYEHARTLRGARILQINATAYGGGVSELLRSCVPLLRDLGLEVDWKVISGSQDFFRVTKAIHNGLQGAPGALSHADRGAFLDNANENAAGLDIGGYDYVVVHDPQPAALPTIVGRGDTRAPAAERQGRRLVRQRVGVLESAGRPRRARPRARAGRGVGRGRRRSRRTRDRAGRIG
jgi:trehalose synthase